MAFKDLSRQVFVNLSVIRRVENNKHGHSMWLCKCDCGRDDCLGEIVVSTIELNRGKAKNCGCGVKLKDITGQRFGRLIVLSRAENRKGRAYWAVQCDCGSEVKEIVGKNLRNGNTQSCGCLNKERVRESCFQDLTGKRFGRLVVIDRAKNIKKWVLRWNCICDCGKTHIVGGRNLRSGICKSCGCLRSEKAHNRFFDDLTGRVFGRLKVLSLHQIGNKQGKQTKWLCECECGNNTISRAGDLKNGGSTSCGCLRKDSTSGENNKRWVGGSRCFYGYKAAKKSVGFAEDIRRDPENKKAVQVKCVLCDRWFTPTSVQVGMRKRVLDGNAEGDARFYCSDECKQSCSIYGQRKWPKGFKPDSIRNEALDPALNKLVLERDNHECQKCGATENLHVHHIEGVAQVPMLANDMDNCITVCIGCHSDIHAQPGCSYYNYQRYDCEQPSLAFGGELK